MYRLITYISFPLFLEFILKLIYNISSINNLWAPILISITLILPFFIIKNRCFLLKSLYIFIIYIPIFINISHIVFFNSEISQASFLTLFETNIQESLEFIHHFLSKKFIIILFIFWLPFIILFINLKNNYSVNFNKRILVICFFILYSIFCFGDHRYKLPFEKILFTYIDYQIDLYNNIKTIENRPKDLFEEIKISIPDNIKQTYVVVIGESANKNHMSIYESSKKTTPKLDDLKQELFVFKNVKSSYCHTQKALTGVLCLNEKFQNGDIITFLKEANFKTFWVSNQYTSGNCDSLISMIGTLSDSYKFINKSHYRTKLSSNFDESLLDHLDDALKDKSNKKVIFLHLLGSHFPYLKRYPSNFQIFKPAKNDKRSKNVSDYDNSILYTDYILDKIISRVKNLDEVSFMLYFSDHGEDITDDPKSAHSHVESLSTPPMFDIPFIIWMSDKYKNLNKGFIKNWDLDKKYETKFMFHSLLSLFRLKFDKYNEDFSIFGE